MLEYRKGSTHANTNTDYVYRANIIIYDLTRATDAKSKAQNVRQYPFIKMRIIE